MPHRQFSAPSVRPAHSCRTPVAPSVCPTILLSTHPRRTPAAPPVGPAIRLPTHPHRLFICLHSPFRSHTCHTTRLSPIRLPTYLHCPSAPPARLPAPSSAPLSLPAQPSARHLLIHTLRLSAPSVPLSTYLTCRHARTANTRNSRNHPLGQPPSGGNNR